MKKIIGLLLTGSMLVNSGIHVLADDTDNYVFNLDFETPLTDVAYGSGSHAEKIIRFNNIYTAPWPQHSYAVGVTEDEAYSGTKSLEMYQLGTYGFYPSYFSANIDSGTLYEFSMTVKLKNDSGTRTSKTNALANTTDVYYVDVNENNEAALVKRWGDTVNADGGGVEKIEITTEDWTTVKGYFLMPTVGEKKTVTARFGIPGGEKFFYADDVYLKKVGEVGAEVTGESEIEIPKYGEEAVNEKYSVKAAAGGIDFTKALDAKTGISLKEEYDGVTLENGILTVSDSAHEQEIILLGSSGDSVREYPVKLKYSGEKVPEARNVGLVGNIIDGEKLELKYDYYDPSGFEKTEETIAWQGKVSESDEWEDIAFDEVKNFIDITSDFKYAMVRCSVSVKNSEGIQSEVVWSNTATKPQAPVASNVVVSGEAFVGETLTASYEWYDVNDINKEKKGTDKMQWYRLESETAEPEKIDGANEISYTLTSDDACKFLMFGVIPVSAEEPCEGEEVFSEAIEGPVPPNALNVKITKSKSGKVLTGSYEYSHDKNVKEGQSIYKWYLDGEVVSEDITYTVPSGTKGTVYFEVTPVAEKEPYEGESVRSESVSVNVTSSSKGSGGGGGSIGGGFISGGKVPESETILSNTVGEPPEEEKQEEEPTKEIKTFKDIENHWAKEYIEELAGKGIANGVNEENFNPDGKITRAEFSALCYRAFEIESFNGDIKFNDVSEGEWYFEAIQAIAGKGIVNGYGEDFKPLNNITRQEAAKVIWQILNVKSENEESVQYNDHEEIGNWAKEAVAELSKHGIITGSNGMFRPLDNITRAEAAVILSRTLKIAEGGALNE